MRQYNNKRQLLVVQRKHVPATAAVALIFDGSGYAGIAPINAGWVVLDIGLINCGQLFATLERGLVRSSVVFGEAKMSLFLLGVHHGKFIDAFPGGDKQQAKWDVNIIILFSIIIN